MNAKSLVVKRLAEAGVKINGNSPTDIQIYNQAVFGRILRGGALGAGESYMERWWDTKDLAGLICKLHKGGAYNGFTLLDGVLGQVRNAVLNVQSQARAFMVGKAHYDLGSDLYQAMLDKRMVYTSAVWKGVETLEAAQEQKLEMICQKLGLKAGDRVLDIGCGWGSFMKYAVEKYDVSCVGLTVSEGQTELGRKLCAGMPIEFVIKDYRDYDCAEKFDHIVSIEMIEAVGAKNLGAYFEKIHSLLKPNGKFALQAIGSLEPKPTASRWIDKYIFPNGVLPSLPQLEAATRYRFIFEDLENIGPDYDRTLMEWWRRFDTAYPELSKNNPKYDDQFYRMWKFYLQTCAGQFRSRVIQDWQIVFSPIH